MIIRKLGLAVMLAAAVFAGMFYDETPYSSLAVGVLTFLALTIYT